MSSGNPSQAQDTLTSQYAVLGAMARGGAYVIHEMQQIGLTDAHFDHASLALTFRVICRLSEETGAHDGPCDKPLLRRTIALEMRDLGMTHPTPDELVRAIYETPFAGPYAVRHGEIVRDAATLRLTKMHLSGLHAEADLFDGTVNEFIAHAQGTILSLSGLENHSQRPVAVPELLPGFWERLQAEYNSPTGLRGLDSGYPKLNQALRGLCPGHLIIVAAESGYGKSAFATNIATNVARHGKSTCLFSLEMEQDELLERIVFSEARIAQDRFTQKSLTHSDWEALEFARSRLSTARIRLYDDSNVTTARIASTCRYAKWAGNCDLVIVDYTQLVSPSGTGQGRSSENREREVAKIAEDLKRLAGQLKVPVMALSQLNDDGKMRESRAIKQHANSVLILKSDDALKTAEIEERQWLNYDLDIDKNRHGKRVTIPFKFFPAFTRFDEEASFDEPSTDTDGGNSPYAVYDHSQLPDNGLSSGESVTAPAGQPPQPGFDGLDEPLDSNPS